MEDLKLEFTPEENPMKNVFGVAYSGGQFSQPWEDKPLVLDLEGLVIAPQIPLLLSHENHPDARLGVVQAVVVDNQLLVDGGIDQGTEEGRKIVQMGKQAPWQLSIGARVVARELVGDDPVTVNGREFTNCVIVRRAILREVSVVAVGADPETELMIAAALHLNKEEAKEEHKEEAVVAACDNVTVQNKENIMDIQEIVAKETARIDAVTAALADNPEVLKSALVEKWSEEQAKTVAAALKKAGEKMPEAAPAIISKHESDCGTEVLEAALELRAGIAPEKITKNEKVLEEADKIRHISLREVAQQCMRNEGKTVRPHFDADQIRAAFSTASLPTLLGNIANKKLKQAFEALAPVAPRLCREADLPDYKLSARANVNDLGGLSKIEDGQEIPNGVLGEEKAYNQVESYAEIISIGHKMLANDDLGAFLALPQTMGQKAAQMLDKVYFTRLLSNPVQADGVALFNSGHGNYLAGATYALSKDALIAAKALFGKQVTKAGDPIAVAPRFLVVPTELEGVAQELVKSLSVNGSTTANKFLPTYNVVSEWGLEVVVAPWLSNANYAGNSATGWYLIADPAQCATAEIAYLNGQREPLVEQSDAPFNFLGIQYRVRYDFGIREQDTRGWVFANGTN